MFVVTKFRMSQGMGIAFFLLYIFFITYALVHELVCVKDGIKC